MVTKTHHKQLITTFTAALCLFSATSSSMLMAAEEVQSLPMTYVTVSTRTPLSLDRISPSVDYISAEEIELWQDRDLIDTLRRKTSMNLITSGGIGAQTSLFTRGTESNHTSFFVDGRRFSPGFGNQYNLEYLNLGNLSSVQVQRGASSVHYGSSGIGGVVDLRTASGLNESELTGSISAELGSNDYRRGALDARYGTDQFGISLSGSALSTDNERRNDAYESVYLNGRFDFKLTDVLFFELLGLYSESEKGLPNSIFGPKFTDEQDTTNWLVSPGIRYESDNVSAHLFYARSENKAELDQLNEAFEAFFPYDSLGLFPISNEIEVDTDELNLQVDFSLSEDALLTLGGVYREDDARNSNLNTFSPLDPAVPYSRSFEQTGVYAQLLWLIGDLELRAGLRYDDYSEFDNQTTGNFEAIYNLDSANAAIFAKVATSYAPPGASDLAFDSNASTPLEPEESVSFEFGWRQSLFDDTLTYSVIFFRNEIDELLDFVYDPMTFSFDSVNVEQATTEGVEFQAVYTGIEKLELSFGYTYLTATADYQDDPRTEFAFGFPDAASDVRLARRPRHQVQISAIYQFTESFRAGVQGIGHFDRQDIQPESPYTLEDGESYFVARLIADWQINDAWSIYARVENLLDEEYAPAAGFPALGRAGYIGAKFKF